MEFERARMANLFAVAQQAGPFGELPTPPPDFDPQVHVSRNDGVQPFFLICERDTVVATLGGDGAIEFHGSSVREHRVGPGDFVYVPAGTPHRIRADAPLVQFRFKARDAGLEATAWYCPACDAELWRREFETEREIPQRVYLEACEEFNAREDLRTCERCGTVHDPVEVSGVRWREIAELLEAERVPT